MFLVGFIQKFERNHGFESLTRNSWHFLFWQFGQAWMALEQSLPEKYMYKTIFITLLVGPYYMMGRKARYIYIDTRHGEYPSICQNLLLFLDDFATDEVGHSLHIWDHRGVWVKKYRRAIVQNCFVKGFFQCSWGIYIGTAVHSSLRTRLITWSMMAPSQKRVRKHTWQLSMQRGRRLQELRVFPTVPCET